MPLREPAIPAIIPRAFASSAEEDSLRLLLAVPTCGAGERAELRSISEEADIELRQAALRSFGARQESKGRLAYAASAYEMALSLGEDSQAQRRLNALHFEGSFGDQAELLFRDFFRQATSPEMLGGMAAGSLIGQGIQAVSLARLLGGQAAFFTRGIGARGLASGLGLLGEAPAVVLASKGLRQASGASVDWGAKSLGHEILGMGLSLGMLKSGSALTAPLKSPLLHQAGSFTALFAANRLESAIGLRAPSSALSALMDSAAMLFQFQIGGKLLNAASGGALSRSLSELQMRSRLNEAPRFPEGPSDASLLEFAGAHGRRPSPVREPLPAKEPLRKFDVEKNQMSSIGELGGGANFLSRRLIQRLSQSLGVVESDSRLSSIVENYSATPFYHQQANSRASYFDMLANTQLQGTDFTLTRERPAVDLMLDASLILRRAMEMNPFRGGNGSFYDFLTQVAFEQTLQSRRVPVFDALVHTLTVEPRRANLEEFFLTHDLHHPFARQKLGSGSASMDHAPWLRQLETVPVSEDVRFWLAEYLLSYSHGLFSRKFRDALYNYYLVPGPRGLELKPMVARDVFESLRDIFADPQHHAVWQRGFEQLTQRAAKSPLPLLYFDRFFKLKLTGDLQEKVSELFLGQQMNPLALMKMMNGGTPIDGTIFTGYVSDPILAKKFENFYRALPELIHPANSTERLAEHRLKARDLLEGRENYGREQILELLYHRPTQRAAEARQAIQEGEVGLEVLTRDGMRNLMQGIRPGVAFNSVHDALYLPAKLSPTGLPYIAILQLDPALSREEKIARAPYLAAYAVHEFDHHRYSGEIDFSQRSQRLKAELRAWLEENLYLLTQGDKSVWDEAEVLSPEGFAVYLRTRIEQHYLRDNAGYLQKSGSPHP
jgi:hypothetical protein